MSARRPFGGRWRRAGWSQVAWIGSREAFQQHFNGATPGQPTSGTAGKLQTFFSVAYLRDGKPIAGARDGSLYMWNKEHRLIKVVAGHDAAVYVVTADKNGGLHSGGGDCAVRTWPPDLATGSY